mgnify:CR=1 FL=1
MRHFPLVGLAAIAVAFAAPLTSAWAGQGSKSSSTTYYSHGKPVGRAVTHGNTTTYYSHGKPVGRAVTSGSRTTVYSNGKPVTRSGRR